MKKKESGKDKSCWHRGIAKLFDLLPGKHLIQYDGADKETLELKKEKVEWVEEEGVQ